MAENPVNPPEIAPETETQREKLSVDEILVPIREVLVPAEYLPSTIPVLQRLKDAPYKFKVIAVSVKMRSAYWLDEFFFLSDGEGLVDLVERTLYYRTRRGTHVYKIRISEEALPKELKYYTRGVRVNVVEYEDGEFHVLLNMKRILTLAPKDFIHDKKTFVVSLLFHILQALQQQLE
jgi:hypothetical protein